MGESSSSADEPGIILAASDATVSLQTNKGAEGIAATFTTGSGNDLPFQSVSIVGFELLEELGRGGMGVVYKARQLSLNRLVALKVVLAGAHVGPEALTRFRGEAEAVARLRHPNIVQVFEIGESAGVPYFSLEFLEGGSLDRQLRGTPQPSEDAARLVETLARAAHEAHAHGIVHRDLKPANVLLTADGTPKIADFGLAKRLDDESSQTRTGTVLGTPSYMAPEQAGGKSVVGPSADVYSLGAVLYELLTGQPPFKAATALDTVLLVVSNEPLAPSKTVPGLPRDLEIICLKCLEKNPARRFASAAELADDLHRFLAGEPILSRSTPWWERGVKWVKRRPTAAALMGVSLVAIGVLLTVGIAYQAQLWQANQDLAKALKDANDERDNAGREHRRAEGHLHKALEAVDKMLTQVGNDRLANVPQFAELRKELLEEALVFYRGFLDQESEEPAVRRETARAYFRIAGLSFDLGQSVAAEKAAHDAMALQEKLVADFPTDADIKHDLAKSAAYLGHVYATTARFDLAAKSYQRALTIHEKLATDVPDRADYSESVASAHMSLGFFNSYVNGRAAEQHFRAAATVAERLAKSRPEARYKSLRAACGTNLGVQLFKLGRFPEAEKELEFARAILWPKGGVPPVSSREYQVVVAKNEVWYGILCSRLKRDDRAETSLREGIAAYERLLQTSPGHFLYRTELAAAFESLAAHYDRTNQPALAAATWEKGIDLADKMHKDYPAYPWLGLTADRMRIHSLLTPARQGRITQVIDLANNLAQKKDLTGDATYDLACVYALVAEAAAERQKAEYADQAILLLRCALHAGYFRSDGHIEHAKNDDDLKSLREHADFRALLVEAKSKLKTAPRTNGNAGA